MLSTAVCALLGLIYLGSSAAFNAFTGGMFCPVAGFVILEQKLTSPTVATICLGCSYAYPTLCSLLRKREAVRNAPFSLGRAGFIVVSISDLRTCQSQELIVRTVSQWCGLPSPLSCFACVSRGTLTTKCECFADLPSYRHSCHPELDELRQCRVCRILIHRHRLVRRLRQEALQGSHPFDSTSQGGGCRGHDIAKSCLARGRSTLVSGL